MFSFPPFNIQGLILNKIKNNLFFLYPNLYLHLVYNQEPCIGYSTVELETCLSWKYLKKYQV